MMFMRHDRANAHKLRTNSERCAQVGALFATLLVIVTAILLYFGITTEHGEQKSVFFIVSVVNILALCVLIGITVYYVRKFMIREELNKINAKFGPTSGGMRHNLSQSRFIVPQSSSSQHIIEFSNSSTNLHKQQQQQQQKPNYALNQPVPIIIRTNTTLSAPPPPGTENKENKSSFGFYQI